MGHVEVVLDQVKPVGRKVMAGTQVHRVLHLEGVVHGKRGLAFRGAEEGEDDAAILVHRVRPDADLAPYGARLGFQRRLEEAAVDTVEPPVIAAANPLLLDAPVLERSSPVHAVPVQQTEVPRPGAEEHQVLPEQRDRNGQVRDLGGKRHRVPEAPQVLPAGCARTDPGELDVFRGPGHGGRVVPAVGNMLRLGHRSFLPRDATLPGSPGVPIGLACGERPRSAHLPVRRTVPNLRRGRPRQTTIRSRVVFDSGSQPVSVTSTTSTIRTPISSSRPKSGGSTATTMPASRV